VIGSISIGATRKFLLRNKKVLFCWILSTIDAILIDALVDKGGDGVPSGLGNSNRYG